MVPRKKADHARSSVGRALTIKDCLVWTENGFKDGSILIEDGKISKIARIVPNSRETINGRGLLALPGLIDAHVHLRDMEQAYKEDFTTGTSAAAAGGFTSLLDMPNTEPPVDSPKRLTERMKVASGKILVNVGFHVAAGAKVRRLRAMAAQGAFSYKLYMPRPVSPLRVEDDEEVLTIMRAAADTGVPITIHAEDPLMISDPSHAESWLELAQTRPEAAEARAVGRMLRLQASSRCSIHFAHTTLPSSLKQIWTKHSSSVTSEVTPHHLLLSQSDLGRLEWRGWMVPPLRSRSDSRRLLAETSRGMATIIASDHAPHALVEKRTSLHKVLPGIPGLETTLFLLLRLVNQGRLSMKRVVDMLTIAPAERFGIQGKGRLRKGADGDIVLVNPTTESRVRAKNFLSKAKFSPFEGFETRGRVEKTIVGGRIVFDEGMIVAPAGTGRILKRTS